MMGHLLSSIITGSFNAGGVARPTEQAGGVKAHLALILASMLAATPTVAAAVAVEPSVRLEQFGCREQDGESEETTPVFSLLLGVEVKNEGTSDIQLDTVKWQLDLDDEPMHGVLLSNSTTLPPREEIVLTADRTLTEGQLRSLLRSDGPNRPRQEHRIVGEISWADAGGDSHTAPFSLLSSWRYCYDKGFSWPIMERSAPAYEALEEHLQSGKVFYWYGLRNGPYSDDAPVCPAWIFEPDDDPTRGTIRTSLRRENTAGQLVDEEYSFDFQLKWEEVSVRFRGPYLSIMPVDGGDGIGGGCMCGFGLRVIDATDGHFRFYPLNRFYLSAADCLLDAGEANSSHSGCR